VDGKEQAGVMDTLSQDWIELDSILEYAFEQWQWQGHGAISQSAHDWKEDCAELDAHIQEQRKKATEIMARLSDQTVGEFVVNVRMRHEQG
jgi:predicted RNA-binding protein with PIN domain